MATNKKKTITEVTKKILPKIPTDAKLDAKEKEMQEETVNISKEQWDATQKQIKMLLEVADKGRVFNYENQQAGKEKKVQKVKLSLFAGGIITGWRTIKDVLIKHPTTGLTAGEEQQYEVIVLLPDNTTKNVLINGYPQFSDARYTERVDCDVLSKSEEYSGAVTLTVLLPDGRELPVGIQFVN